MLGKGKKHTGPETAEDFAQWLDAAVTDVVDGLNFDMKVDSYSDGLIVTLGNGRTVQVTVSEV